MQRQGVSGVLSVILWWLLTFGMGTFSSAVAAIVNQPPIASAVRVSMPEDSSKIITLKGKDPEGKVLTYTVLTQPLHGRLSALKGNKLKYIPRANFFGADKFTFKVNDGKLDSTAATVKIGVTAVNDRPKAIARTITATDGTPYVIKLAGIDVEDKLRNLIFAIVTTPAKGSLSDIAGNIVTYAPTDVGVYSFTYTVTDKGNLTSAPAKVTIKVQAATPINSNLNDTGITKCSGNSSCPQAGYPGQDAESGRDVTANDDSDGKAGFSFTKISDAGMALPNSATDWACVKDNVTGLMWEVKTNDYGIHHKDWTYIWYEPDNTKNGGAAGQQDQDGGSCGYTSQCDTYAYVKAVNTEGWCGFEDWRMPTKKELVSIVSYSNYSPPIDSTWFPNTGHYFWSSDPDASDSSYAWYVSFYSSGSSDRYNKKSGFHIRLVRSGK